MELIQPLLLYAAAMDINKIYSILEANKHDNPETNLVTSDDCAAIQSLMEALKTELIKLNCPVAAESAKKPIVLMEQNALTYGHVMQFMQEIDGRIRDELKLTHAFSLSHLEASIYNPSSPLLGIDVALKFESAAFDIEESGKCHALGRSTGAVFHAFRVLEVGIKALAKCLHVEDLEKPRMKNWGFILDGIETAIKARWEKETDRDKGDGELFWEVYTLMLAIKTPRNGTMHPAKKYTEQEADRIIRIIGDIMRRLAERMDEEGIPKLPKRRSKTSPAR